MKKVIIWIFVVIAVLAAIFGVLYVIDMDRIENNEPVLFSTWGYDYVPPVYMQDGIALEVIRDMVATKGEKLTWSDFKQYKSTEIGSGLYILLYEVDENYKLMIGGVPTAEPMYIRLVSQKNNEEYIDIRYDNIEEFLNRTSSTTKGENSFIGTVLEETTTYMIVEPNEDEDERKSADKIRINYGVDHNDYLFGIGRKVLITYSGYIMETYPAQINTNNITTYGYQEFELIVEKLDNIEKRKVLNNKELYEYNSDYNLYYYGLNEVKIKVDGKVIELEEALRSGKITLEGIISKANSDVKKTEEMYSKFEEYQSVPRLFPYSDIYKDGGSTLYHYEDYAILKCHTLDGNRDVYIGTSDMTINMVKE